MTAIVVDDSKTMRSILGDMLKELGFRITEAENGADAVAKLEGGPVPDLALIDWRMPGMDGYELLQRLGTDATVKPHKVMMVTAEAGVREIAMALRAGADEYMMKPFTKEDFRSKLQLLGVLP